MGKDIKIKIRQTKPLKAVVAPVNGVLCTGHMSRDGKLVNVRPCKLVYLSHIENRFGVRDCIIGFKTESGENGVLNATVIGSNRKRSENSKIYSGARVIHVNVIPSENAIGFSVLHGKITIGVSESEFSRVRINTNKSARDSYEAGLENARLEREKKNNQIAEFFKSLHSNRRATVKELAETIRGCMILDGDFRTLVYALYRSDSRKVEKKIREKMVEYEYLDLEINFFFLNKSEFVEFINDK